MCDAINLIGHGTFRDVVDVFVCNRVNEQMDNYSILQAKVSHPILRGTILASILKDVHEDGTVDASIRSFD